MPPKGPTNSNKVGSKQQARIKKPNISQNQKNSRLNSNHKTLRRSLKSNNQSEINEESPQDTPEPIQRRESWLDKLPPVIKPDQELHIQLTKERKIKQAEKHIVFCKNELFAMLNVAYHQIDNLNLITDKAFIEKVKFDFLKGNKYHQNIIEFESRQEDLQKDQQTSDSNLFTDKMILKQSTQEFFNKTPIPKTEIVNLTNKEFDSNPELNKLFGRINDDMQPYCKQSNSDSLLELPFLIAIVGPPCSGKTTITQFIASHFDVHVIVVTNCESSSSSKALFDETKNSDSISYLTSPDDKLIISSIQSIINELPSSKGIIIENFPETKSQLTQLEKSLQGNKKKNESRFQSISGFIRTSMTADEASKQVQHRLIDKSTNLIFHTNFNPPNSSPYSNDHTEPLFFSTEPDFDIDTATSEISQVYSKLQPQFQSLDSTIKKSKPALFIEFCPYIGNLQLKVESFLKYLYKQKCIEPPFNSFVTLTTNSQYNYSFLCYKVMNVWENDCITQFGLDFDTLYSRLDKIKDGIDNLSNLSKIAFSFIISMPDDRKDKAIEFLQNRETILKRIESLNSLKELRERFLNSKQSSQHSGLVRSLKQTQQRITTNLSVSKFNNRPFTSMNQSIPKKQSMAIQSPINRPLTSIINRPSINSKPQNVSNEINKVNSFKPTTNSTVNYPSSSKQLSRPSTSLHQRTKELSESQKEYMILEETKNDDFDAEIEYEKNNLEGMTIKFYHYIWERSIEIRDLNCQLIDQFIINSPLKILKVIMDDSEKTVFTSLVMRFFIIEWFMKNVIPILENAKPEALENSPIKEMNFSPIKTPTKPKSPRTSSKVSQLIEIVEEVTENKIDELPTPNFPQFDPNNLKQICELMSIPFHKTKDVTSKSALTLENAYLMTPDHRFASQSVDDLNSTSNEFDFPEYISFEHPPTTVTTPIISTKQSCREQFVLDDSFEEEEICEEEDICEEEEIKEKLFYSFHFPEKRHKTSSKTLPKDNFINKTVKTNSVSPNKPNLKEKSALASKSVTINNEKQDVKIVSNQFDLHKMSKKTKKKDKLREDYIINFLDYIYNELTDPILQPEAAVMKQFFVHFISIKDIITNKIDEKVHILKNELKEMIKEKCAHEMENFSYKFRNLKENLFDLNYTIQPNPQSMLNTKSSNENLSANQKEIIDESSDKVIQNAFIDQSNSNSDKSSAKLTQNEKVESTNSDFVEATKDQNKHEDLNSSEKKNQSIVVNQLPHDQNEEENDKQSSSEKDNQLNQENPLNHLLFTYDTSYMNSNCKKLYEQVNGDFSLPSFFDNLINQKVNNQYQIDRNKVKALSDFYSNKNENQFVSISELKQTMELMKFSDKEKAFVVIRAMLQTIPEYIDILPFLESLTKK